MPKFEEYVGFQQKYPAVGGEVPTKAVHGMRGSENCGSRVHDFRRHFCAGEYLRDQFTITITTIHNTYCTILRIVEDIFLLCVQNSLILICQQNDAHYFMDHPVSPCPRFLVARGHNRGRRQPEQQQQQQ